MQMRSREETIMTTAGGVLSSICLFGRHRGSYSPQQREQQEQQAGTLVVPDPTAVVAPVQQQPKSIWHTNSSLDSFGRPVEPCALQNRAILTRAYDGNGASGGAATVPRGLTGLYNLGNTCYFAAAVQALAHCPPLVGYLLDKTELAPLIYSAESHITPPFWHLLRRIWSVNRESAVSPVQLLSAIRAQCVQFRGWTQQDAQELLRCLLSVLHEEMGQPEYEWQVNATAAATTATTATTATAEELGRKPSVVRGRRPSSSSSSTSSAVSSTNDRFETADSGWSSDTEKSDSQRRRRRVRSENASPQAAQNPQQQQQPSTTTTTTTTTTAAAKKPVRVRSIVSDVFDGRLESCVRCLTCHHVSRTTESFQDLSLPVPSREQVEQLSRAFTRENSDEDELKQENDGEQQPTFSSSSARSSPGIGRRSQPMRKPSVDSGKGSWFWFSSSLSSSSSSSPPSAGSWWSLGAVWSSLSSLIITPEVSLEHCLAAFFSPDRLVGDDMYACERCKMLRNGEKLCRLTQLPEVLVVHVKRFRHDGYGASKVTARVTFPLTDLDMAPFTDKKRAGESTLYDLCALIVHRGAAAECGHYIAYCKNENDGNWYEFDDSCVTKVDAAEVAAKEAYVLFYERSRSAAAEQARAACLDALAAEQVALATTRSETLPSKQHEHWHWVSADWLSRMQHFATPGPISNAEFLCSHGHLHPRRARHVGSLYVRVAHRTWNRMVECYGGGPAIHQLCYCERCDRHWNWLQVKKVAEMKTVDRLKEESRLYQSAVDEARITHRYLPSTILNSNWLAAWHAFVRQPEMEPPGPIDNEVLLVRPPATDPEGPTRLGPAARHHPRVPRPVFRYLQEIYGGGPEVFLTEIQPSAEELEEANARIERDLQELARAMCEEDVIVDDEPLPKLVHVSDVSDLVCEL